MIYEHIRSNMKGKKILVTGGTGFVGAYLLHYLVVVGAKNIRAIKRSNSPMNLVSSIENKVEWVNGDLLDTTSIEEAMEGVDQVYHCAAIVSFNDKDRKQMFRVNQNGTENIVNIALSKGISKLLHVSSIAALGRSKGEDVIDEKTKWKESEWNSPYGKSKYLAEMEVWRGMAEGLNAVIVNPSNVLGSGFWKDRTSTAQFFYKIWKGMPFYPLGSTGFVDVRDVVQLMVKLMDSDISGERFIINGENLSFKSFFDDIADAISVKKPSVKVTPFLREIAWRLTWLYSKFNGKKPFITKHTARSSARNFSYKNDKIKTVLPYKYTPIEKTVTDTGIQFKEAVKNEWKPFVLPFQ